MTKNANKYTVDFGSYKDDVMVSYSKEGFSTLNKAFARFQQLAAERVQNINDFVFLDKPNEKYPNQATGLAAKYNKGCNVTIHQSFYLELAK